MSRTPLYLVLALTLSTPSWAQTASEAAIHHLMDQQAADWNRGDVDAFMKAYEDAPTTTFVGKTVEYGYATIRERYKRIYPTPAGMGKLTFSHLAIMATEPQLRRRHRKFPSGANRRRRRKCGRNLLPGPEEGSARLEDYSGPQQPNQLRRGTRLCRKQPQS